ncbi:MAG TPA: glycosyltransferase family 39 protein [Terriglobales bacterium]|nr:glycosyltransferase family 39 protein [Terriglobales bacterium]
MTTGSIATGPAGPNLPETVLKSQPSAAGSFSAAPSWLVRHERLVLGTLIVMMLAQLWTSVVQLSITSDEIDHLHAAYRYWQCNDFGWNPEHPPLVKIVAGLPLQFLHINDPIPQACGMPDRKDTDFIVGHAFAFANPERMLTAARFAASLFSVLLLLSVWFFARKLFGLPVAAIAGVLIAFDPNILAHGALVTTDVAAALGILLAIYAAYCYAIEPNFNRLLAFGLATGLAFCAKHSSILLAVILPIVLMADAICFGGAERRRRLLRYVGALVVVGALGLTVLWASYGFRYAARPGGAAIWSPPRISMAHGAVATQVIPQLERWHVLPEAYLVGLQDVLVESELGRASFLLGKLYPGGNWFYFPVAMAIKFTLPFWLMVIVSALTFSFWKRNLRELLFLLLPALIFLGFSMNSGLNIGIRHLLPVLSLLTIFGAAGVWSFAREHKWVKIAVIVALALQVATSLHAYPNYLSYSNELWGGPGETYRYLAYSDDDWGQAQKMARAYIDKTHPANCYFLRTYNNKNSDYGIPCAGLSEIQWDPLPVSYTGTMIVSSSMVDGIGVKDAAPETRRIFKDLKPVAKLGGSALLVYKGTFNMGPLVASQLLLQAREIGDFGGDQQAVLELAQQAAKLDPLSGDAHVVMCASYQILGQMEKAQQECNLGLELVRKDPQYGPRQVKDLEEFILKKGLQVENSAAGSVAR